MRAWKWLGLLGLLGGCTLPPIVIVDSGAGEAAAEAGGDDAGSEASVEAGLDASPEASLEAGPDAGPEASADAAADGPTRPPNDDFANAIEFPMRAAESTVNGTLVGATMDQPAGLPTTGVFAQPNVWYRFTLLAPTLVYLDTSGTFLDTGLAILLPSGQPATPYRSGAALSALPGMANDNSGCQPTAGGMSPALSATESATGGLLGAGTYYVAVSATTQGPVVVNLQRIPLPTSGIVSLNLQSAPLDSVPLGTIPVTGTRMGTTGTTNVIDGAAWPASACGFTAPNPEQGLWFFSCGGWSLPYLSLCPARGGTFPAGPTARAGITDDPVMYRFAGITGAAAPAGCIDDTATPGCAVPYGYAPTLTAPAIERGIHLVVVDERGAANSGGMPFTLGFSVQ